jgi:hypothetical protein
MGEIAKGFGLLGGISSSQEKGGLQLYGGFFDKNPVAGGSFTFPGIVNTDSGVTLASLSTTWSEGQGFTIYHSGNLRKEKKIDSYKLVISQNSPGTLSGATLNVYRVTMTSYTSISFTSLLSKSLADWPGAGVINTFTGDIDYTPPRDSVITFGITTPGTSIPNLAYALTINFSNDLV